MYCALRYIKRTCLQCSFINWINKHCLYSCIQAIFSCIALVLAYLLVWPSLYYHLNYSIELKVVFQMTAKCIYHGFEYDIKCLELFDISFILIILHMTILFVCHIFIYSCINIHLLNPIVKMHNIALYNAQSRHLTCCTFQMFIRFVIFFI